jgi:hypothetical protein
VKKLRSSIRSSCSRGLTPRKNAELVFNAKDAKIF